MLSHRTQYDGEYIDQTVHSTPTMRQRQNGQPGVTHSAAFCAAFHEIRCPLELPATFNGHLCHWQGHFRRGSAHDSLSLLRQPMWVLSTSSSADAYIKSILPSVHVTDMWSRPIHSLCFRRTHYQDLHPPSAGKDHSLKARHKSFPRNPSECPCVSDACEWPTAHLRAPPDLILRCKYLLINLHNMPLLRETEARALIRSAPQKYRLPTLQSFSSTLLPRTTELHQKSGTAGVILPAQREITHGY